jgi:hypothetical protein
MNQLYGVNKYTYCMYDIAQKQIFYKKNRAGSGSGTGSGFGGEISGSGPATLL